MPMKYTFDEPIFVRVIGMAHGLLFVAYIIMAIMLKFEENWSWKKFGAMNQLTNNKRSANKIKEIVNDRDAQLA